jgi:hypothetical protein
VYHIFRLSNLFPFASIFSPLQSVQPINFSEAAVNEALGNEKQFKNFFCSLQVEMRQGVRKFLLLFNCSMGRSCIQDLYYGWSSNEDLL